MRFALLLLAFAVLAGCCSKANVVKVIETAPATISMIETMRDSTVAIVVLDDEPEGQPPFRLICAGVWVDRMTILTAAHCTDEDMEIIPGKHGYTLYGEFDAKHGRSNIATAHYAKLIARDERQDLALMRADVDLGPHAIAKISQLGIAAGEHVNVVGHTTGLPYSYTPGWIGAVRRMKGPEPIEAEFIQVFAGAWGGNSGGGMFDDEGDLLGICSWRTNGAPLTFFVSRDTVAKFLAAHG